MHWPMWRLCYLLGYWRRVTLGLAPEHAPDSRDVLSDWFQASKPVSMWHHNINDGYLLLSTTPGPSVGPGSLTRKAASSSLALKLGTSGRLGILSSVGWDILAGSICRAGTANIEQKNVRLMGRDVKSWTVSVIELVRTMTSPVSLDNVPCTRLPSLHDLYVSRQRH